MRARDPERHRVSTLTVEHDRSPDQLVRDALQVGAGQRRADREAAESIERGLQLVHGARTVREVFEERSNHGGLARLSLAAVQIDARDRKPKSVDEDRGGFAAHGDSVWLAR